MRIAVLAADPIINLAIWVGIGIFIVNICLIIAILCQRYLNIRSQQREKLIRSRWMPIIVSSLAEIPVTVPQIQPQERVLVLHFWLQVDQTVIGESRDRLHQLAHLLSMPKIGRRFLESRQLDAKLLGISVLGSLKERSAILKLEKLANSKNHYISVAAAAALVKIDVEQFSELVSNLICDRLDWSLALVVEILSIPEKDELIAHLMAKMSLIDDIKLSRVFQALEVCQKTKLLPLIPKLLDKFADSGEIVAGCLRIISSYHNSDRLQIIRKYINHPDSSVRVQAANGLSQMGTPEDEPRLIALLVDPAWWVRYRAAQALASLPSMNLSRLAKIQAEQKDPFARDILIQVIAENQLISSLKNKLI